MPAQEISGRDLIFLCDGLFLLARATHEIHKKPEGVEGHASAAVASTMTSVLILITILEMVFSLDFVIFAIGGRRHSDQGCGRLVSIIFVMVFTGTVREFVNRHPTVKMLALKEADTISCFVIIEVMADAHDLSPVTVKYIMASVGEKE